MLLLSIHPRYVDAILAGSKTVELRRRRPRIESGKALIYASAPRMELVASFRVAKIVRAPLGSLWQAVRHVAGISRQEFDAYFSGLQSGVAISIADVTEFGPVPLDDLRAAWDGFHPPQGFRYLDWSDVAALKIDALSRAA
jgi:predicted transcriptional regulator